MIGVEHKRWDLDAALLDGGLRKMFCICNMVVQLRCWIWFARFARDISYLAGSKWYDIAEDLFC